jgi:dolichol-phosphate mannosyltransferase
LGARAGRMSGISSWPFYLGGRFLSWLTSFIYGAKMTDIVTGYKVFKTTVLRDIQFSSNGFEFCPEVTVKVIKKGIPILEVPISYIPRSVIEGKKIRWTDGVLAAWTLLRFRFR